MIGKFIAKSLLLDYLKAHDIVAKRSKVGINFEYEGWVR